MLAMEAEEMRLTARVWVRYRSCSPGSDEEKIPDKSIAGVERMPDLALPVIIMRD